jgi:hypothetical protein
VAVTFLPESRVALTVVGRYVGSQRFQNKDTSQWGTLGSSRMVDARLDLTPLQGLGVWVRGTNLTDANVQGQYSFPEPGREMFAGISLTWPEQEDTGWGPSR